MRIKILIVIIKYSTRNASNQINYFWKEFSFLTNIDESNMIINELSHLLYFFFYEKFLSKYLLSIEKSYSICIIDRVVMSMNEENFKLF